MKTVIAALVILLAAGVYQTNIQHSKLQAARVELILTVSKLQAARVELRRDDKLLAMLLDGWDRASPVFSKPVTVTCYTSRRQETDNTPHITASNRPVRPGTLAVSRDLLPLLGGYGAKVVLAGYGLFEVTDVMNKRYTHSVDIWTSDLKQARLHGRQTTTLIWQ